MPNRVLKESVCTSDTLDQLTWFEEVVFYRLLVNCDDYGRFDGRSAVLRSRLFPLKNAVTEKAVRDAIHKLSTVGLVTLYEYEGRPYLQLVTWEKHQQVRAKKSKYPALDRTCSQMISDDPICPRNPIQSESESNPPKSPKGDGVFEAYAREDGELLEAFHAFEEMRGRMKSPMTLRAKTLLLRKLDDLSAQVHNKQKYKLECLNQSILQNWKSVYPLDCFDDRLQFGEEAPTPESDSPREIGSGTTIDDLLDL